MDAVILSVGTELVTGQCLETNAAWIAGELFAHGVCVGRHVTVGDEPNRLETSIRHALTTGDLVVITGGLGPTEDDLTRQAIAAALGVELEENTEALEQLSAFLARAGRSMTPSNRRQVLLPRGCQVIRNPRGTAPGLLYQSAEGLLAALPGVPSEMKAMFAEAVVPRLGPSRRSLVADRLLCFGVSEANLGEVLSDMMARDRNPLVGTTACGAILSVRVIASGGTESEARALLEADLNEVRRRVGNPIFARGEGFLEEAVARLLREAGKTIATAESCTGGLVAKRLTDVPGSSDYFLRGYVAYADEAKVDDLGLSADLLSEFGSVSEPVARAMAERCRVSAKSDLAIGITGLAGPGGGAPPDKPVGLVYVALAHATGSSVQRYLLGEHLTREEIRDRTAKCALNLVRLRLIGPSRD